MLNRRDKDKGHASFWSPALPVAVSELCDTLQCALAERESDADFKGYVASIIDEPRGAPDGWFELAFNDRDGRACVVYADEIRDKAGDLRVATTPPVWVTAGDPLHAAEVMFRKLLED